MIRLWKTALLIAAWLAAGALAFGFLSPYLQVADSVSHFRLHLAAALLVLAGLMLLAKAWRAAFGCGTAAAIGIASLAPLLGAGIITAEAAGGGGVKLFQLNAYEGNARPQAVLIQIQRYDPDVITLQEVGPRTKVILDALGERYPNRMICQYRHSGDVVILSRLPRAEGESEGCVEHEGLAWLRLLVDGQPVTFASVHLAWPYPMRQHQQLDVLKPHLETLKSPIAIGGDFNASPWSHALTRVADAASARVASGIRLTWGVPIKSGRSTITLLPIDHVLMSRELVPLKVETGRSAGSDHLPVLASFALRPPLAGAGAAIPGR